LNWAKDTHGLKVVSLSAAERKAWDAKLSPMVTDWVKEMSGKGLPAEKFIQRVQALRDQMAK